MAKVKIYMTRTCGYCRMALNLLEKRGADPEKILVDAQPGLRKKMIEISGRYTVPQIFIDDYHVGGYDDLVDLDMDGELVELLKKDTSAA
ncbi:MAG: glutaredoxin 3 [Acidiferrobacterales bacterium]|jgi:glutaredoxin 3|nr:glutaredoxin 3 [Acidiferrobacterales bacterium]